MKIIINVRITRGYEKWVGARAAMRRSGRFGAPDLDFGV